jgi:hypothetical protein
MFGFKSHVGRHHPDYEPADAAGADPWEALSNRRHPTHELPTEADRDAILDVVFPPKGEVA